MSVQIHFHFFSFRRRQKVMGHFIFSSKILRREFSGHLHNPDLKSDGSSDRFISGQFTESFLSPIIELVITCDRIYQGFPVRLFFGRSSSGVEVARLRSSDGSWIPGLTLIIRYGNGYIRGVVLCGAIQISFFRPIVKFIVLGIWPIGCLEIS